MSLQLKIWGCRGSIPTPGESTVRFGGNTSCVEVRPKGAGPIIIDAGTGLRRLGKSLMEEQFGEGKGKTSILISHTHWDHVQGLPFFSPLYRAGNRVHIFARQRDMHLEAVFSQQHNAPYFPVPLAAMQADMHFHELIEGDRPHIAPLDLGRIEERVVGPDIDAERPHALDERAAPRLEFLPRLVKGPTDEEHRVVAVEGDHLLDSLDAARRRRRVLHVDVARADRTARRDRRRAGT